MLPFAFLFILFSLSLTIIIKQKAKAASSSSGSGGASLPPGKTGLPFFGEFSEPFEVLATGIFSLPIDLPGTVFNKAIKASNLIRKELRSIIKQRKIDLAEKRASPTQDIPSHMLLTPDEDGKYMHEMDIADKIRGLMGRIVDLLVSDFS